MKSFTEILDELKHVEVTVRCRNCGAYAALVGKQYSTRCPRCGTEIRATPKYLTTVKTEEAARRYGKAIARTSCRFCQDTGYVITTEQVDDQLATFAYRCLCAAGEKRTDLAGWPRITAEKVQINTTGR